MKIITGKQRRAWVQAIRTAKQNSWTPTVWPFDDAEFEIGCCLDEDVLIVDKDFLLHLGEDGLRELRSHFDNPTV
jgi:hypothetical protein